MKIDFTDVLKPQTYFFYFKVDTAFHKCISNNCLTVKTTYKPTKKAMIFIPWHVSFSSVIFS